ncbi:hypothetical protein LN047_09295 [Achromobacter sp. JD417]|uniref:hypothetical protein n=1 Tax=Achromobacter sp. JD417 TaxID=2893881 RepID=UPI0035A69544
MLIAWQTLRWLSSTTAKPAYTSGVVGIEQPRLIELPHGLARPVFAKKPVAQLDPRLRCRGRRSKHLHGLGGLLFIARAQGSGRAAINPGIHRCLDVARIGLRGRIGHAAGQPQQLRQNECLHGEVHGWAFEWKKMEYSGAGIKRRNRATR